MSSNGRSDLPTGAGAAASQGLVADGALFYSLFEAAPDAMMVVDEQGIIRCANVLAHRMFKWPANGLIGQPVDMLVPLTQRARHAQHRQRFVVENTSRTMGAGIDLRAECADGTEIWVDVSLSPIDWCGVKLVIVAVRDITERRRSDRQVLEALHEKVVRDPLTGLFNRRMLDEALSIEVARAARAAVPIAVIMVDIDHFKQVNDRYGHSCGDHVLQQLAVLMLAQMRGGDLACRYGGEEFTLILPGCTAAVARERAEQIRSLLRRTTWSTSGCPLPAVTASFGVAAYPQDGATAEALMRAADSALLQAKTEGRDRVVLAG
jgi:diguanylate cyclase (GGDEF)-like protein/PAS domain S-box-containing protein